MKKIRKWVKVVIIILVLIMIALLTKQNKIKKELEEKQIVGQYIECLQDNFMQRDYCGNQINKDYRIMDQTIKKYGFDYEEKGKDLIIVKVD